MTINEQILKFLDTKLRADMIQNYETLKRKASGNWANQLEPYSNETKEGYNFGMKGAFYTVWLQNGRNKNKDQSEEGILKFVRLAGSTFIKKWVDDKGINFNPFAVAFKIAREGYNGTPNLLNKFDADYFTDATSQIINQKITDIRIEIIQKK